MGFYNSGKYNDRDKLYSIKHTNLNANNYVDEAEAVIKSLSDGRQLLTTSKIRNILSLVSDLGNDIKRKDGITDEEIKNMCGYIRMRFAYEAGRDSKVKLFVNNADLIGLLKSVNSINQCQLFCNYIEALVAYHKFYGGRD